jgi:hypothetical protein
MCRIFWQFDRFVLRPWLFQLFFECFYPAPVRLEHAGAAIKKQWNHLASVFHDDRYGGFIAFAEVFAAKIFQLLKETVDSA